MVQAGALASMGSTGREMGVAAADMAVQLIQGQELAQVPVSTLESTDLSVNQTTLNALTGVTFPRKRCKRPICTSKPENPTEKQVPLGACFFAPFSASRRVLPLLAGQGWLQRLFLPPLPC